MKYMDFIVYGPLSEPKVTSIPVRALGIKKLVIVRTKGNGGFDEKFAS